MADLRISTGCRNALLDAGIGTAFDSGALEIRNGTIPANADAAPTGTLLASVDVPADGFNAAAAGAITKNGTWTEASAPAASDATWFRLLSSTDGGGISTTDIRIDGDVTVSAGGGDLELDNVSIGVGQQVTINTFTITMPAS